MKSVNNNGRKLEVSSKGLIVILGLLCVIVVIIIILLTDFDLAHPLQAFTNQLQGFTNFYYQLPSFGGMDCPENKKLNTIVRDPAPCKVLAQATDMDKPLTDTQFLEYMIAHHQVAVNMAKRTLKSSQNQYILELARRMVWQQGYEITMMHAMLGRLPQPFSKTDILGYYNQSLLSYYKGLDVLPAVCYDDMFLEDVVNGKHHLPALGDRVFLEHMISHHELGLKMSRLQINYTNNSFMLGLLYDIIRDQEQELDRMLGMQKSTLWENSRVISA